MCALAYATHTHPDQWMHTPDEWIATMLAVIEEANEET